uniref:Uncharacterized protein n=1 Tax=Nelumbo nucifera TaxID=4432 RepID=A0A822Y3T5_NELNU|nr:TPA_asm: hypothetical protein HUJ06_027739 [Nelumbo nucifera]
MNPLVVVRSGKQDARLLRVKGFQRKQSEPEVEKLSSHKTNQLLENAKHSIPRVSASPYAIDVVELGNASLSLSILLLLLLLLLPSILGSVVEAFRGRHGLDSVTILPLDKQNFSRAAKSLSEKKPGGGDSFSQFLKQWKPLDKRIQAVDGEIRSGSTDSWVGFWFYRLRSPLRVSHLHSPGSISTPQLPASLLPRWNSWTKKVGQGFFSNLALPRLQPRSDTM